MSNMSEGPRAAASEGAALTKSMDGAVAVLSMGLAPYNLMDKTLNRELVEGLGWAQSQSAGHRPA